MPVAALLAPVAGAVVGAFTHKSSNNGTNSSGDSYLPELLGAGLQAGASIYGAHTQGSSNEEAMRLQDKYNEEALAAQKEQDAFTRQLQTQQQELAQKQFEAQQAQQQFVNQQQIGSRDYTRGQYNQYLTRLQPFSAAGQQSLPRLNSLLNTPFGLSGGAGSAPGGQAVTLIAPSGERADVPVEQADHYLALGAKRA